MARTVLAYHPGKLRALDICEIERYSSRGRDYADTLLMWGDMDMCCGYRRKIVMEIGYFEHPGYSREELWSISLDGFAGEGWFYEPTDSDPKRPHPTLEPLIDRRPLPALLLAQKPGDRALGGSDHYAWLNEQIDKNPGVKLRQHPKHPLDMSLVHDCDLSTENELRDACENAGVVIGYSTSSLIKVACWGYPFEGHGNRNLARYQDREKWIRNLSYRVWRPEEMTRTGCGRYLEKVI